MIYTIVKETTTFETYSVASDTPEKKLLISVAKPIMSYATYKLIGLFK